MEMNSEKIRLIYDALSDKKGNNIVMIDIHDISILADCFMIADGDSHAQVRAMADSVEEQMQKAGYACKSVSGYQNAEWILMDYYDVVVHIFMHEDREFYDLERLWRDGKLLDRESL